jgi:hypothetical protein
MTNFNYKIEHPTTAFLVLIGIAALFSNYGEVRGAAILFGIFAGISLYKMFTSRS